MRFFYALALCVTLSTAALAQTAADQNDPEIVVAGPAAISTTINNFIGPNDLPGAYFPQDTSITNYIAFSIFTANNDGATGIGVVYTRPGVTAQAIVARQANGAPAFGCTGPSTTNTIPPSDIANSLSGKIAFVSRSRLGDPGGVGCSFVYKVRNAMAAGAVGVILFNGDEREGPADVVGNAIVAPGPPNGTFTLPLTVPVMLVPNGIAQPIVDQLASGATVTLTMRSYLDPVAAEEGPSTTASGLEVPGANPFSGQTALRVFTQNVEAVRVDVFNVRGQQVATLFDGTVAGERAVTFSSAGLSPGVYFVRATGETFTKQQQVTVVR